MAGQLHEAFLCVLPTGSDAATHAQVALESGHDQAVLFAHYRELVRPKDAERYFSIRPASEAAGKIVAIGAA